MAIEVTKVLVIGASGRVGSRVVRELDALGAGVSVRLASSKQASVNAWQARGRDAVLLDLNSPYTLAPAMQGVDRVFLLTPYADEQRGGWLRGLRFDPFDRHSEQVLSCPLGHRHPWAAKYRLNVIAHLDLKRQVARRGQPHLLSGTLEVESRAWRCRRGGVVESVGPFLHAGDLFA
ncbi:TPA: SDR family oxidoreductase [Stenotrophomonas maltophilia]